jgi:hypothetical protein
MNKIKKHIPYSKLGDIAKIGHQYYQCIDVDLWEETKNQKYNF